MKLLRAGLWLRFKTLLVRRSAGVPAAYSRFVLVTQAGERCGRSVSTRSGASPGWSALLRNPAGEPVPLDATWQDERGARFVDNGADVPGLVSWALARDDIRLYLYVGTCTFRNAVYPMLVVPIHIRASPGCGGLQLVFGKSLVINQVAIDFVLQHSAAVRPSQPASRVHRLRCERSVGEVAAPVFDAVAASFGLRGRLSLAKLAEEAITDDVTLSTHLCLCACRHGEEVGLAGQSELLRLAECSGGP